VILQAAVAFNLVCSVTSVSEGRSTPATIVYRVDLDASRYCTDDCRQTLSLARTTESDIVFQDGPSPYTGLLNHTRVSRESGNYFSRISGSMGSIEMLIVTTGSCERAPFTGFPARQF
jgi:hypothetical protein